MPEGAERSTRVIRKANEISQELLTLRSGKKRRTLSPVPAVSMKKSRKSYADSSDGEWLGSEDSETDSDGDEDDDVYSLASSVSSTNGQSALSWTRQTREELLLEIEELGPRLPRNLLDDLIFRLDGPDHVAELTGRKGRIVQNPDGSVDYESRAEINVSLDDINMKEKKRFMNGDKLIAILSEAASSGISLQSDKRVKNQRQRLHITLELPWSADKAIQQFGRTHRSNQANTPQYVFLISNLAGERRFAASVARRLESLGALLHGDRRAAEMRDLSEFNVDNRCGRVALNRLVSAIAEVKEEGQGELIEEPVFDDPDDFNEDFFRRAKSKITLIFLRVES